MASLFDGTEDIENIGEIYDRMEANCPNPWSTSQKLWELRRASNIALHNTSPERMIEKAVSMLAARGHMPGWFNQCPTASGIGDSSRNRRSDVDLVHWSESDGQARLVELKWMSDEPLDALKKILCYGAAFVFCQIHRRKLPLQGRPLMDARHVSLEVVAPACYYRGHDLRDHITRMRNSLDKFNVASKVSGLSMSLNALAFPKEFNQVPFKDGEDVKKKCSGALTAEGQKVCEAFKELDPVWPAS